MTYEQRTLDQREQCTGCGRWQKVTTEVFEDEGELLCEECHECAKDTLADAVTKVRDAVENLATEIINPKAGE